MKLVIPLAAVLLTAAVAPAQSGPTGTYNYNDPVYHMAYPPTGVYPGGSVNSYAYRNPGDPVPTTYVSHYRRTPPVVVPVTYYEERYYLPPPVVTYSESYTYYGGPVAAYPTARLRGRWR